MPGFPIILISSFFFAGSFSHFIIPDFFIKAIPAYLPCQWQIVIVSGVFELLGAIGILIPKSRLVAAYGLMILCVVVFPVNINMALYPEQFSTLPITLLYLRLPAQVLLIWFIWWAVKSERLMRTQA